MTRFFSPGTEGRVLLLVGLNIFLLLAGAAVLAADPPDPFEAGKAAYRAAETDGAKLEIIRDFLQTYPGHAQVGFLTGEAVHLLRGSLDDYAGAVALARQQEAAATDPQARFTIQELLLDLYSKPVYRKDLQELVGQMYDPTTMTFVDHLTVLRAATGAEAWALVDEHAAAAAPQATPAAFRAAYADRDFSDDYIEASGRNRQGLLKTFTGWSAANQGDPKRAIIEFKEARALVRKTFLGLPDNELFRFWGLTMVRQGDQEQGLEMLALAAVFGTDDDATQVARQAYLDLGKSEDKYEDFLWTVRTRHGVRVPDFQAADYQGVAQSFNGLRGKKATLLAFWFPT